MATLILYKQELIATQNFECFKPEKKNAAIFDLLGFHQCHQNIRILSFHLLPHWFSGCSKPCFWNPTRPSRKRSIVWKVFWEADFLTCQCWLPWPQWNCCWNVRLLFGLYFCNLRSYLLTKITISVSWGLFRNRVTKKIGFSKLGNLLGDVPKSAQTYIWTPLEPKQP